MTIESRLRTQLVIIGAGDPGDLSEADADDLGTLKGDLEGNSHRDVPSAMALCQVLMAQRREM